MIVFVNDESYNRELITNAFISKLHIVPDFSLSSSFKFAPVNPETGTNVRSESLKPTWVLRNFPSFKTMSSNRSFDHCTVSSLLTATIS